MCADTVAPCVCRSAWICLEGSLSTIRTILHYISFINFSLPSTSREVSYSAMGCKLLDDVVHSGHRNIKISGDGLCSLVVHAFPQFWFSNPQTILCSSFFSPCSVWYTQTHNTKVESTFLKFNCLQVWFLCYQHLLLATGEFNYKLKEHHMLEIQLFLTILKRCLILSSPFLEFCVEWSRIGLFFLSFVVFFQCTQNK